MTEPNAARANLPQLDLSQYSTKLEFNTAMAGKANKGQSKTINVPALALGATQTINVVWDTPMASSDYLVIITPTGAATLVGKINYMLVEGSQTTTGCQVAVSALLALSLGQIKLKVYAI